MDHLSVQRRMLVSQKSAKFLAKIEKTFLAMDKIVRKVFYFGVKAENACKVTLEFNLNVIIYGMYDEYCEFEFHIVRLRKNYATEM